MIGSPVRRPASQAAVDRCPGSALIVECPAVMAGLEPDDDARIFFCGVRRELHLELRRILLRPGTLALPAPQY